MLLLSLRCSALDRTRSELGGCAFAPPGIVASLGAGTAMALLLLAMYYALAFDHTQLKQSAIILSQSEDRLAAKASAEESNALAFAQISQMQDATTQKANDLLTSGNSLDVIKAYYAEVLQTVRADREAFQALCANECKVIETADREVRDAGARFDDRSRRWWPGRLVPAYTRAAAARWISALEKRASARFNHASSSAAVECYDRLASVLAGLAAECAQAQSETAAAVVEAGSVIDSAKRLQNVTGCNKHFPLPDEIALAVETQVRSDEGSIRHAIACRPPGLSLGEAIRQQALKVAAAVPLPKTFNQFFGGLNGAKQLLLKQVDLQSSEFAVANPFAGRQRIRHRFLLVEGGEMSPVAKDVKAISKDMIVRTVDHPHPEEFVCVTEERFSPVGENHEVMEAFRRFRSQPAEKRGSMIVAVDEKDEEFLVNYSPESAYDPSRPARLLFVALVLGVVHRTGAECYKVVDPNDPGCPNFAKGLEQAIQTLATDDRLARQVEQALDQIQSVEGVDAIRRKLLDAKSKALVPLVALKHYRETIDAEIQRLNSLRPALAA